MTTETTDQRLVWIGLALIIAFIALSTFGMWFGMMGGGPMMGGVWGDNMWRMDGASGGMMVIAVGIQLLLLALVVGATYLGYRVLTGQDESSDPALEELRVAYARGDLSDEEYERRRERLESDS